MRGSGGTEGGLGKFGIGAMLCAVGVWLLLDSIKATSGGYGVITGAMNRMGGGRGGMMDTTSMGIVFVPFFIGVVALFYDYKSRIGWWVGGIGLGIIILETLSRIRFVFSVKTSYLLLMLLMIAGGIGFILASFREARRE